MTDARPCLCPDEDCGFIDFGYPWCRSCAEHHRPPECALDQEGNSLATCGCRWDDVDQMRHRPGCVFDDINDTPPGALPEES